MHLRPLLTLALVACGAADAGFWSSSATGTNPSDLAGGSASTASEPSDTSAPPETEVDRKLLPPAQTDVFVFVANPDLDTVTRVHVNTSEVRTTGVGVHPTSVVTTRDYATAVVLNEGEHSLSIVDAATLDQQVVEIRPNMNHLELSPDGAWAVTWYDAFDPDAEAPDGLLSFNEASFVEVATGTHFPMVVGYRPRQVAFTPDARTAAIVSDDFLAVVDLTAPTLVPRLIALAPGELNPPIAQETILDPSGTWAYVRQFGAIDLLVVDLLTGALSHVPVGGNPTDLDLSPDGATAAIVARDTQELYLLDALDPFAPAEVLTIPAGVEAGQLAFDPTGAAGILFTTASAVDRYARWDIASGDIDDRALVKPVQTVALTPDGRTLVVFHTLADAADTDPAFVGEYAVSMIALDSFVTSPLVLDGEPTTYAQSNDGDHGYFVMEGLPTLVRLDYATLLHEEIPLKSVPIFLGVLPNLVPDDGDEPRTWVSQEHELGRISFYDPDDNSLETLTGFELNSGIEE